MNTLLTSRLKLREWSDQDRAPFAELCADPEVMRFFPDTLSQTESDRLVDELQAELSTTGIGVYAVEELATGEFVGAVGLHTLEEGFPFSPCVEAAWRIRKQFWGKGMAPEAARICIHSAFEQQLVDEVVAMTALINLPSEKVMIKLGMARDASTFMHPKVAVGHELREHMLYRISRLTDGA